MGQLENTGNYKRKSNLELLRLVCMFYIVLHHFLVHALFQVAGYDFPTNFSLNTIWSTILDAFLFVAVNCFVLISGYCGIKLKINKLIQLFVVCAFYGVLFYFLHLFLDHQSLGRSVLYNSFFIFSNPPGWWFIQTYFFLCLISPLLNDAISVLSKKRFILILFLLSVLNIYFGFMWSNELNPSGYNLMNFIYLYMIGRFIRLYLPIEKVNQSRYKFLTIYLVLSLLIGTFALLNAFVLKNDAAVFRTWVYNNPLIIISSVAFFCFFLTIKIQSRKINWLASSAIAIYLIHENSYLSKYLYGFIGIIGKSSFIIQSSVLQIAVIIFISFIVVIACILIDKVFQIITVPVTKLLIVIWNKIKRPVYCFLDKI